MSEYAGKRNQPRLEDLDNRDTLFADNSELDNIVDTQNIDYSEARQRVGAKADEIEPKNGPHVSLTDRYREELLLMDLTSANSMRKGFSESLHKDDIVERYGGDLPQVAEGAHRNMRINNQMIRAMYRADELKKVGFSEHDVDDDVNIMRAQYRLEYAGPENANKRAKRRRYLREKLGALVVEDVDSDHTVLADFKR